MHLLYVNAMTYGQGSSLSYITSLLTMTTHILGQGRGQLENTESQTIFKPCSHHVRACQYLLAEELLKHLAEKLQVEPQMLWRNPHSVRNLVWGRYKVANFK